MSHYSPFIVEGSVEDSILHRAGDMREAARDDGVEEPSWPEAIAAARETLIDSLERHGIWETIHQGLLYDIPKSSFGAGDYWGPDDEHDWGSWADVPVEDLVDMAEQLPPGKPYTRADIETFEVNDSRHRRALALYFQGTNHGR